MIDVIAKQIIEDISNTFKNTQELRQASAHQVQSVVESALKKLNLVTREEFDAQSAVLHRCQQTIQELEVTLQKLQRDQQTEAHVETPAPHSDA